MSLKYFGHGRLLTLSYQHKKDDGNGIPWCTACGRDVFGFYYKCDACYFVLHKACAKQPRKLQHPWHPEHPLTILEGVPAGAWAEAACHCCGERLGGYTYHCSQCNFNIHVDCASLLVTIEAESHEHPLTLLRNSISFSCYACKREGNGLSYFCATCHIMIHPECGVPLPLTVKVIRHEHPLKLTSSVQVNQSHHRICQLCVKVVDTYRFYYCSICDFAAHQDCATNEDDMDETFEFPENKHKAAIDVPTAALKEEDFSIDKSISIDPLQTHPPKIPFKRENSRFDDQLPKIPFKSENPRFDDQYPKIPFKSENPRFDESINSVSYVAIEKKMIEESYVAIEKKMIEDSIDIDVEIKHFSHEHSLKLTNELLLTDEKCDGCIQCIQPPFYSCPQCPFFLHESCIKLPRKKRQLLHRHQLTLLPKAPYKGGLFLCRACDRICNGFTYNCDKCRFNLDVQCSLIPNKFTHEGHVHPLTYSSAPCKEKCSCCDSEGKVFRCADCEFTLDVKCATLPRNVRYRPFDQPFKLCYSAEDNSGEYYCDICEKRRDHEHWFYHCSDLQFPAHPRCILGAFPNIKFGRTITSSGHSHPLTLVHSSKDHTQCCKGCKGRISEILSFECAECNFNFHVSCLEGLDDIYIGHPLYPHSRIIGDYSYDSYYQ